MKLPILSLLSTTMILSAPVALAGTGDTIDSNSASREILFTGGGSDDVHHVILNVESGKLFSVPATTVSGGVGVGVHRYLSLGVALGALATGVKPEDVEGAGRVGMYYGGIYATSRVYTWRFLSADVWSLAGGGSVGYRASGTEEGGATAAAETSDSGKVYEHDDFRFFQAGLGIAAHVTKRADVSVGFAFRRASDVSLEGLDGGLDGSFPYVSIRGNLD